MIVAEWNSKLSRRCLMQLMLLLVLQVLLVLLLSLLLLWLGCLVAVDGNSFCEVPFFFYAPVLGRFGECPRTNKNQQNTQTNKHDVSK